MLFAAVAPNQIHGCYYSMDYDKEHDVIRAVTTETNCIVSLNSSSSAMKEVRPCSLRLVL
jgi:hypothetical protein